MTHVLKGSCQCGGVTVRFETATPPAQLRVRACQCAFCRKHGALTASDGGALPQVAGPPPLTALALDQVTLCAADCVTPELAASALHRSMALCRFGDAILFTDAPVAGRFRTAPIARLGSRAEYSRFILKELHARVATPFVLIVQWDGYVTNAAAWRPEFLEYDYIGARWPWHADGLAVGNGGFSLRSARLLSAAADPGVRLLPGVPEDDLVCRVYRRALEAAQGIRFAPDAVADRFAYERTAPDAPTFGFHGLFNVWRHLGDAEMVALVARLPRHIPRSREYLELLAQCFALRRPGPTAALYRRLRQDQGPDAIRRLLAGAFSDQAFVAHCVQACERLYGPGSGA